MTFFWSHCANLKLKSTSWGRILGSHTGNYEESGDSQQMFGRNMSANPAYWLLHAGCLFGSTSDLNVEETFFRHVGCLNFTGLHGVMSQNFLMYHWGGRDCFSFSNVAATIRLEINNT
jgi:hypothetical protein